MMVRTSLEREQKLAKNLYELIINDPSAFSKTEQYANIQELYHLLMTEGEDDGEENREHESPTQKNRPNEGEIKLLSGKCIAYRDVIRMLIDKQEDHLQF